MSGLVQKAVVVFVVMCVILLSLVLVSNVLDDRQRYRDEAVKAIEVSYAGPQVLIGPVLVRPYTETITYTETTDKGVKKVSQRKVELVATSFPRSLSVTGEMKPGERRHGLYKVEVYELRGRVKGQVEVVAPETEGTVVWGEPYLALSVTDVRGILGTPRVTVNGVDEAMVQGAPARVGWQPNLRAPLRGMTEVKGVVEFEMDLELAGTGTLSVAPVGDANVVQMRSAWASPLFAGQFLPRTREVGKDGFTARWEVSSLASGTQGQLGQDSAKALDVVSVSLPTLLDPYALSSRAVKYGILFVVLTFGGFFMFESMKELRIHPMQYLLVGLGLAVFFLLLVSFSERMGFGLAYVLASGACIGLLTFYLSYVLRGVGRGLGFGGMLTCLYGAIYGLLISEDNALVLGSVMLFGVLGVVMVVTRRVDWYGKGVEPPPMPIDAERWRVRE